MAKIIVIVIEDYFDDLFLFFYIYMSKNMVFEPFPITIEN